jgi:hypothetical protein
MDLEELKEDIFSEQYSGLGAINEEFAHYGRKDFFETQYRVGDRILYFVECDVNDSDMQSNHRMHPVLERNLHLLDSAYYYIETMKCFPIFTIKNMNK